jgi:hypothetical protein
MDAIFVFSFSPALRDPGGGMSASLPHAAEKQKDNPPEAE